MRKKTKITRISVVDIFNRPTMLNKAVYRKNKIQVFETEELYPYDNNR